MSHEGPGHALPPSVKPSPVSKPRAESTNPAPTYPLSWGVTTASRTQDESSGVLQPQGTYAPRLLPPPGTTHPPRAQQHRCSHFHTSTHDHTRQQPPPPQGLPNTHTESPMCHCPPDSQQAFPTQAARETPALSACPTFPPSQALGALFQPLAPSTDILESPLISLEGAAQPPRQASQASRMAEPWRQPPPPPPTHGQEGKFGSGDREPGPARPTPLPGPRVLGGGGTGISAGSKGVWLVSHRDVWHAQGTPKRVAPKQGRMSPSYLPRDPIKPLKFPKG